MRATQESLVAVLGAAPKPGGDRDPAELAARDLTAVSDDLLRRYLNDIASAEPRPDLFRHAVPACLKFWRATP
jgi:hypothetical protein